MSRSSAEAPGAREIPGSRGGTATDRAQVAPLAALAAVFAVTAALTLYTGALQTATLEPTDTDLAPTALDTVAAVASDPTGVVDPTGLSAAPAAGPEGRRLNATLVADGRRWSAGPPFPATAPDRARRRVAIATAPNQTMVGRLRVVVW